MKTPSYKLSLIRFLDGKFVHLACKDEAGKQFVHLVCKDEAEDALRAKKRSSGKSKTKENI